MKTASGRPREYRRLPSPPGLRDLVESVWIQDDPAPPSGPGARVVPTGTVELLFHYRDPFAHWEGSLQAIPRSYVTGQRTRPVTPVPTGEVGILIVSLFPWGLSCLFPGLPADLTDGYIDLKHLWPAAGVERLEEELAAAASTAKRLDLVSVLLLKMVEDRKPHPRVRAAATMLAGGREIDESAHVLGVSGRHFRRLFQAEVGVSPKTFQRVMRFQHALGCRSRIPSWSEVAAECGYSDQAHLIREFREFTGLTPRRLPERRDTAIAIFNRAAAPFFDTVYL